MPTSICLSRSIHRLLAPAVLISLLVSGGCGGDSSSSGTPETVNEGGIEKIAFVSRDKEYRGINTINPDGTGRKLVSTETGVGYTESASFSPDGSKIAFLSNRDNCGGVGCRESEFGPDYPMQIWTINVDGGGLRQLTRSKAWLGAGAPMFSRGNSRIFYSTVDSDSDEYALHAINLDGSGDTILVRGKELRDMSLSPDGSRIVFSGDRDGDDSTFRYEIYVMNADGSKETRLTDTPLLESSPSFSPDGSRIVFCSFDEQNYDTDIYVMNADGTGQTRLTNGTGLNFAPSFSPDGTRILFNSSRDIGVGLADATATRVFVMNADGTDQHALPAREGVNGFSDIFDAVSPHRPWGKTTIR